MQIFIKELSSYNILRICSLVAINLSIHSLEIVQQILFKYISI